MQLLLIGYLFSYFNILAAIPPFILLSIIRITHMQSITLIFNGNYTLLMSSYILLCFTSYIAFFLN